jgi:hypothetical protein
MVPEVVRDGENGFLAAFDDAEAFARRTEQLADDSAMREGVGESARQTIVGDFRWERTTASAARLYGTAIARFRARCPDASIADLPDPAAAGPTSRMRAEALDAVPRELRDWAASREHLNFMRQLLGMGERRAAAGIALRALARNPLDRCTWREAGPCSPIAPLYRRATSAWHKTRALARVAGPPRGASPRSGTGSADRHAGKP